MPRPSPKFEDHKGYYNGLNIEEPNPLGYNNNTKVIIHCDKGHIYKL